MNGERGALDVATFAYCVGDPSIVRDCLIRWRPGDPFVIALTLFGSRSHSSEPAQSATSLQFAAASGAGVRIVVTRSMLDAAWETGSAQSAHLSVRTYGPRVLIVEHAAGTIGLPGALVRRFAAAIETRAPLEALIVQAAAEADPAALLH